MTPKARTRAGRRAVTADVAEDRGKALLMLFLRVPRLHGVKTRLAAEIGANRALAIYRQILGTLLANLQPLSSVELRFTPDDAATDLVAWARPGWTLAAQGAGDLGHRLSRAFAAAFRRGYGRVAVIGSDCPSVTTSDVRLAWAKLGRADLVIGPAQDGGYWLLALKRPCRRLFQGIDWGGPTVFQTTLARAQAAGLSVAQLDERSDIDTPADWERYIGRDLNRVSHG